jgi:hypothetical protein
MALDFASKFGFALPTVFYLTKSSSNITSTSQHSRIGTKRCSLIQELRYANQDQMGRK